MENSINRWFVFCDDKLLLRKSDSGVYQLPDWQIAPFSTSSDTQRVISLANDDQQLSTLLQDSQFELISLRDTYDFLSNEDYNLAGQAKEIIYFDENSKYCPVCGSATESINDRAKRCTKCSKELYPPIAPAVVIRITRGDEILLVRSKSIRHNILGFVAGFLEVGETLEECVEREIMEEVGLKVKDIRYFGSQPWPYPCGVMVGYTAEYAGGELKLQEEEISSAIFFTKETLPDNIPPKLSIARMMIDDWLTK